MRLTILQTLNGWVVIDGPTENDVGTSYPFDSDLRKRCWSFDSWQKCIAKLKEILSEHSDLKDAQRRIAALEAALRPFADFHSTALRLLELRESLDHPIAVYSHAAEVMKND